MVTKKRPFVCPLLPSQCRAVAKDYPHTHDERLAKPASWSDTWQVGAFKDEDLATFILPEPILDRTKLLGLIRLHSLEVSAPGTYFEAPGGGRTTEYFNIKRACMSGHLHELLAPRLYQELLAFAPVDAVAGIVLGGCHLASVLAFYTARESVVEDADQNGRKLDILYVRKASKDHGRTPGFIEGCISKGARVVLLDDIVSAGKSATAAAGHLRGAGLDVRGIITVIDKRRERPETLSDGTPLRALFTIDELLYEGIDMKTGEPLR